MFFFFFYWSKIQCQTTYSILLSFHFQALVPATAILLLATYLQYTIGIARLESFLSKPWMWIYIQGCLHIAYIISGALNEITSRGAYNLLYSGVLTYCIYHIQGRLQRPDQKWAEEGRRGEEEVDRGVRPSHGEGFHRLLGWLVDWKIIYSEVSWLWHYSLIKLALVSFYRTQVSLVSLYIQEPSVWNLKSRIWSPECSVLISCLLFWQHRN